VEWATARPVLRVSQLVRSVWAGPRRELSSVAYVRPRSGDGATANQRVLLRQRMQAALKLLFGPAKIAGG
jgi:hypothetical protein